MPDKDLKGSIGLETLPPSNKIYQGVNNDGWLLLRSNLAYTQKRKRFAVTERLLVALVLTGVCCKIGKGKVRSVLLVNVVRS